MPHSSIRLDDTVAVVPNRIKLVAASQAASSARAGADAVTVDCATVLPLVIELAQLPKCW
jgi:hypothetical protein